MLCTTPRDAMLALKKLSTLLEDRDLEAGAAIFGSVVKHPKHWLLTLFDMRERHDAPKNIFDYCAETLRSRKLKLCDF